MADFRKLLPALALFSLIALLSVPANAQIGNAFTCAGSAGVPPTVRAEGLTELVGDIVLNCSGSAGVVPPGGITANVQVFLNTNVTSRLVGSGDEALLILNEDATGAHTYQGQPSGLNSVVWLGVPVLGAGSTSSIIRITNLRADAHIFAPPTGIALPQQIISFISITSSTSVPVSNPQLVVAIVSPGLLPTYTPGAYRQCVSGTIDAEGMANETPGSISWKEGFASSFKPQIVTGQNPSVPGTSYNSESGFIPPGYIAVGGAAAASVAGIGTADSGTRLQVVFTNIPSGAVVNVPTIIGTSATSYAWLTNASTTNPGYVAGTWYALTAAGTTATATYEVAAANPFAVETFTASVALTYVSNPGAGSPGTSSTMALASFGNISTQFTADTTSLIPRFIQSSVPPSTIATMSACVTNLLFPYLTTVPGFDTGISIANTGVDVAGLTTTSPGQSGTCTVYLFGTGAPGTAPVTGSIAAGTVYAWSMYNGSVDKAVPALAGFTGYGIIRCNFQYGHGYAFISNLGLGPTGWAQSYLALVIPDRGGDRPVDGFNTAPAGAGEMLGQ